MQQLDWSNLPFGYMKTNYNVRCTYKDGKWGDIEVSDSEYVSIHMASTSLHYGQQAFEGMKAYKGKDNKVRLFRWEENAKRLQASADGIFMAKVPNELFLQAVIKAVKMNADFVPPHGTGASLYIRPLLFGSSAEVGVKPAREYTFIIFVTPVGPYFKEGFNPTKIAIVRDSDRAAPLGTGTFKVGGNYAASLRGTIKAQKAGYSAPMYLDCVEKKYIDEIGAANFFGIKNNTYITPKSPSILASITNKSIITLAEDLGFKVERRPVAVEELDTFEEVGACGTAAVISPIGEVNDLDTGKVYKFCRDGKAGPISKKLYETLVGIQYGDIEDKHGWITIID
ncbi:MAG: branched-chain amino acid aminotransferase [Bacteroidales bacterium]|jgi:branched-chain amino acid aminotransferase|nr:branched-chain amino acid aminotransferase [Bacteroidales bacterium]MDD4385603.1 branched-chain amino acid aminotransferase [Bacteroidales bacterium]MDY0196781.1 branched-chain amino acid aminotransferase [Tenuifilaceae bacterium]